MASYPIPQVTAKISAVAQLFVAHIQKPVPSKRANPVNFQRMVLIAASDVQEARSRVQVEALRSDEMLLDVEPLRIHQVDGAYFCGHLMKQKEYDNLVIGFI